MRKDMITYIEVLLAARRVFCEEKCSYDQAIWNSINKNSEDFFLLPDFPNCSWVFLSHRVRIQYCEDNDHDHEHDL